MGSRTERKHLQRAVFNYLCLKYFDFKKIGTKVKMVTPRDEADDKGDEDG